VPADSASEILKFPISIPRESCTNAKAKYSSSVVPPDPSVHFYHWNTDISYGSVATRLGCGGVFKFVTNFLLSLTVKEF